MERDRIDQYIGLLSCYFNSHAHVERDVPLSTNSKEISNFNSHAHVERDFMVRILFVRYKDFNSHAHVERDRRFNCIYQSFSNFNSHAHVERDELQTSEFYEQSISTHTLTWSVTLDVVYIWCLLNVMRTYFFI